MKTIKSILIATTLVCATAVSSLSAQQAAQPAKEHQWKVAVGDSVMIKRECVEYLTGERPSVWVWDKVHTVRQLGTKRFPEGVLLMNIYSWICEECLIPVTHNEQEVAEQPKEEPKAQPVEQPKEEPKAEPVKEEPVVAPVVEPVKEEPKAEPKAEPVEEPKEETPVEAQKEEKTAQTNQGDSIHSQQNFKHSYDRFTIGLRGGAAGLLHKTKEGNWTCGGDVVLDLQYAHYWTKDGRPVDLGIITGVGLGYAQSSVKSSVNSTRPGVEDLDAANPMHIDYTIRADEVKEHDGQLQLEVPLMFSLIHQNGLFFNVGPKFMIPVYTPYKQTVNTDDTHISAYFQETGVTVVDKEVTGVYTGQQPEAKNGIQFNINVMLTAEIGYEWVLKSGNSLGLGAYANYSVYNTFKNTPNAEGLFDLTAPTDTDKAHLDVLSATHAYADKLGYFDAGIKVAYHFNFPKKMKYKASKL